jgi:hypothetical protein
MPALPANRSRSPIPSDQQTLHGVRGQRVSVSLGLCCQGVFEVVGRSLVLVSRDLNSHEAWAMLGPVFPAVKATGRPPVDRRTVLKATAWRFRTGAP